VAEIFQPYYTINASLLIRQFRSGKPVFGNYRLNILITSDNDLIPDLYKSVNTLEQKYIFSISDSLLLDNNMLARSLPKLFLFVAMNNSPTGKKYIPVFSETGVDCLPDLVTIKSYFKQQGVPDITLPFFRSDNLQEYVEGWNILRIFLKQPATTLPTKSLTGLGSIVFFKDLSIESAEMERVQKYIAAISKDDKYGDNGDNGNERISDKEEFETEIELWRKRALLYQDFLMISKTVQQKELR
jgi:hypothetical protein